MVALVKNCPAVSDRENTNSAGKPGNSSVCFFTHTRWSNGYSKLVRIIKL